VLRPGGQLVSLDFGKPANALWRRLYFGHLRFWVPVLGWLLAGNRAAYAYILPSLASYPGQRGVRTAMERCGFATCWVEDLVGGAMALNGGRKPDGEAPAMQVSPCEIPSDEHAGTQTIH
jgi:demethylmenaquinone methyltransferase/2-methoxy-6-polyprenyl-1,4-benzoquinol methylase